MRQKSELRLNTGFRSVALLALVSVFYLSAFAPSPCSAAPSKLMPAAAKSQTVRSAQAPKVRKFEFDNRRRRHALNEDEASAVMSLGTRRKPPVGSEQNTIERFALPKRDAQWDLRRASKMSGLRPECASLAQQQRAYCAQAPPLGFQLRPVG